MARVLFVFAVTIIVQVLGSDFQATRLTGTLLGEGRRYTVTYTSPRPAVVLWGNRDRIYYTEDSPDVSVISSYSDGQGESTLIQSTLEPGFVLALTINDSSSYYIFDEFLGEKDLPEIELESPDGNVLDYTPSVPFTVRLQYTKPGDNITYRPMWFFNFIDNYRQRLVLETASVFDRRRYRRYMSEITTATIRNLYEASTELNFESQEGIVNVLIEYSREDPHFHMYKGISFVIKMANHTGPFPDNFLDVTTSLMGDTGTYCANDNCIFLCDGFGPDIEDVEVRKVGSGEVVEPQYKFKNQWHAVSEIQLYPVTDYSERFVCTATNKHGKTVSSEVHLINPQTFSP